MRSYTITVNGNVYDVTVEETTGGAGAANVPVAPIQRQQAVTTEKQPAVQQAAGGNIKVTAGAAGKVVDIVASVGTSVKKGDSIVILEIMKMETAVVATEDGTISSIEVVKGQTVEAGALLATMNA